MKKKNTLAFVAPFSIYAGLIVYFSITVLGISDRQISIEKMVRLPILNLNMSLNGFFLSVPLLAIFLYVCFQLYLYKMRASHDNPEAGWNGKVIKAVTVFLLWGSLPVFLFLTAFKYVKTHDPVLSYVIGSSPIVSTLIVLGLRYKFELETKIRVLRRTIFRIMPVLSVMAIEAGLLLFLIPWARAGLFPKYFVGRIGGFFRQMVCVDLSHQNLITEPEEHDKHLPWGKFERCHLEGAVLRDTVLIRANLKGAFLKNSDMAFAVLEEADLSLANLFQVNFWNADLRGANLFQADLFGAFLRQADLRRANLKEANLRYSRLFLADFQEADLSYVDARFADFWTANFQGADLSHANLQGISLNKSNFERANLNGADLQKASLWKANLREASLFQANLLDANLEEADLRMAVGLEVGQLAEVKTLYKANLDQALLDGVRKKYPRLLEKPDKKE